jgi:hypothetical protein
MQATTSSHDQRCRTVLQGLVSVETADRRPSPHVEGTSIPWPRCRQPICMLRTEVLILRGHTSCAAAGSAGKRPCRDVSPVGWPPQPLPSLASAAVCAPMPVPLPETGGSEHLQTPSLPRRYHGRCLCLLQGDADCWRWNLAGNDVGTRLVLVACPCAPFTKTHARCEGHTSSTM